MASTVEIVNRALLKLSAGRIEALDEDTEEARLASAAWPTVRDAELQAHPWSFALARTTLSTVDTAPAFGFARALQLPSDFLRLVMVGETACDHASIAWTIEGKRLLTNADPGLPLLHVRRITDPTLFPPAFVEAVSCRLAMELCDAVTGSTSRLQQLEAMHDRALAEARRLSSFHRPPQPLVETRGWIGARS